MAAQKSTAKLAPAIPSPRAPGKKQGVAYHRNPLFFPAGPTRLALATSGVTGALVNMRVTPKRLVWRFSHPLAPVPISPIPRWNGPRLQEIPCQDSITAALWPWRYATAFVPALLVPPCASDHHHRCRPFLNAEPNS